MPPLLLGHLIAILGIVMAFNAPYQQERGLLTDNCLYNKILSSSGCRNWQSITASTGICPGVSERTKKLTSIRPLTPGSGPSPVDIMRAENLMDLV